MRLPLALDGLPAGWPDDYGLQSLAYTYHDRLGVLDWGEEYLAQPDGLGAGDAWQWRESQARIVAWWYAIDEYGGLLFRRGQIVLPKGSGKSPFAAALSCVELGGPTVFDAFDSDGSPIAIPHPSPYVQLAAVSADQTDNTMSLVISMLREGRAVEVIPGLDPLISRIRTANGKLVPVTASATSREGQRITAAILDEPHLWTPQNGGKRLAAVIRRNLGKMGGRSIETTNTWEPGGESVAEATSIAADLIAEHGDKVADIGLLRYHPKAVVKNLSNTPELRKALTELYRDAPWIDVERIITEVQDPDTDIADARRFYLNEVATSDDKLIKFTQYEACPTVEPIAEGDRITLGFDGSIREDSTALVACRFSDHSFHLLGLWERPAGEAGKGWEVDREDVDERVRTAFAVYDVQAFFADVEHWESYIDAWGRYFGPVLTQKAATNSPVGWDMRGRLQQSTLANERLVRAIKDAAVSFGTDDLAASLKRHILNTCKRLNRYGMSFGKDKRGSKNKIDGYAAMLLADMARFDSQGKLTDTDRTVLVL